MFELTPGLYSKEFVPFFGLCGKLLIPPGVKILVCEIFTGNSDYSRNMDEIYSCNKCWILAFFANITAVSFTEILSKLR
jgi:hypothetical protein